MTPIEITSQQSAHFARAGKIRIALVAIQLIIAIPGAISVIIVNDRDVYWLALAGTVLTILWWSLKLYYDRVRDVAQAARRAGLIANSLPQKLSATALRALSLKFLISQSTADRFQNLKYYASKLPNGWQRLAENIEESAFYTAKLQADSATVAKLIVFTFVALVLSLTFGLLGSSDSDTTMKVVRIALAFSIFIMSSDIFGALALHRSAASKADEICQRLGQMRGTLTEADVLLALMDYSAVVEGAPESLPLVYKFRSAHLDRLWQDYQSST